MNNYTISLTDTEKKAMEYAAYDPQEWVENAMKERARIATEEIVKICVEKCLETNTPIPGSKDDMVLLSFEQGWVKTGVQIELLKSDLQRNNIL
jgi:hypothetical protein